MEDAAAQAEDRTTKIIEDPISNDVWNEIFSPEVETVLADLSRLATDYSCYGCAF